MIRLFLRISPTNFQTSKKSGNQQKSNLWKAIIQHPNQTLFIRNNNNSNVGFIKQYVSYITLQFNLNIKLHKIAFHPTSKPKKRRQYWKFEINYPRNTSRVSLDRLLVWLGISSLIWWISDDDFPTFSRFPINCISREFFIKSFVR